MDVKIAIASSDGVNVNEHFGRARSFLIYRLHDDGHEYLDTRNLEPACIEQAHDDNALARSAQSLADCRGVVASQIGAGAIDALLLYRIMAFTLPGTIIEALSALSSSKRFNYLK